MQVLFVQTKTLILSLKMYKRGTQSSHRSADAGSARHLPWRPLPSEPGVIKFEFSLCTRDGRQDTAVVDLSDPRHRGLFRGVTAPRDRWDRYQFSLLNNYVHRRLQTQTRTGRRHGDHGRGEAAFAMEKLKSLQLSEQISAHNVISV